MRTQDMKKIILSVVFGACAIAVQAGDAKTTQAKDQSACCAAPAKAATEAFCCCCCDATKHTAKRKGAKQQALLSPKAVSLASK